MALINCKECGKQISDSAKQCPHCGCATQFGQKVAQVQGESVALLISCVLAIVGLFLFFTGLVNMLEGIDDYGKFVRWLSKDDEALGTFIKFCAGLGILTGCVLKFFKGKWKGLPIKGEVLKPRIPDELFDGTEEDKPFDIETTQKVSNGWCCSCGRVNAMYVSTCSCGKNKRDQ